MFSDSSSDSESGIRFKTTTTRQVSDKTLCRRQSPSRPGRSDNSYDRRDDRSRNSSRYKNERRSDKYDRRTSPKHYRKSESSKSERSRDYDRNKSRERDRKNDRRQRSRSNEKCRNISIDKKYARSERSEIKNGTTSITDSKLSKSEKNLKICHSENDKKDKTNDYYLKNKREDKNDKDYSSGKNDNDKSSEKFKSIKEDRNKKIAYESLQPIDDNIEKNGETIIKSVEKVNENKSNDKGKQADIIKPTNIAIENKEEKLSEELKPKPKKSKRMKHTRKHKKKKMDLSEGELTPSDNESSFNNVDSSKMYFSDEKNSGNEEVSSKCFIGPEIPIELRKDSEMANDSIIEISDSGHISSEDEAYGPIPTSSTKMTKAQYELEKRAIQIRMDKMNDENKIDEKSREVWMTELPDSKAQHLGLGPRKFRAREGPDMSDRSIWTDTPQTKSKSRVDTETEVSKRIADEAYKLRLKEKDNLQETIVKKLKKKHKRDESLLELHQKKLRKKKKKEKDSGVLLERRRFDRDIDLGVNRFDEAQKKSILKKAQLLDTRFSQGESKFL